MQGPRTTATAWAVIQGIEAAQMIRKGQVLGILRQNLYGQAWVFRALRTDPNSLRSPKLQHARKKDLSAARMPTCYRLNGPVARARPASFFTGFGGLKGHNKTLPTRSQIT